MLTIPSRNLINKGSTRGALNVLHLEAVRDTLAKMTASQEAIDHERSLNQLHVSFLGGRMSARFLTPQGVDTRDTEMPITTIAAGQLASEILPSRFFHGLKELATMDEAGGKVATMAWAKFAASAEKPRMIRTVRMKNERGDVFRAIRSCHSQEYAPYANLEFVQSILDHAGEFRELPVVQWKVSDTGMRIRFATVPADQIQVKTPVPMVEAWNSEVGASRLRLRGGMWRLVCTNGMGHWDESAEYGWIHRGDPARIHNGVKDAFINLRTVANGVVTAYNEALLVSVDDAFAWMEQELRGAGVSERVILASQKGLSDETTTPGNRLASVVDAITLAAQDEEDIFEQFEIERVAARILTTGRSIALKNNGHIPAPE
jgi:hypothetical protein